jgi:hypothetical protein
MHRLVATDFHQQWLAAPTLQRNEPASGGFDAAAAGAVSLLKLPQRVKAVFGAVAILLFGHRLALCVVFEAGRALNLHGTGGRVDAFFGGPDQTLASSKPCSMQLGLHPCQ